PPRSGLRYLDVVGGGNCHPFPQPGRRVPRECASVPAGVFSHCGGHAYPRPALFASVAGYRDLSIQQSEYARKREKILSRLEDFRRIGTLADERLFEEMCFCILAVQSKAHGADAAVRDLV